jgi:hypothetical protein
MSDTARMKRLAPVAVLLALVTACGGGATDDVRRGTMEAAYADFRRVPNATYKVQYRATGLGIKRVTTYWKHGKARVDTVGPRQNSRHYADAKGLIECQKQAEGFDCIHKNTPTGFSFRLNPGPDWQTQLSVAKQAGLRPSTRKILGQTVDCWEYDQTAASLEQETCMNEDGAILSYRGGARGEPYQAVAVSYSAKVTDAEVRAPKARRVPFIVLSTTTVASTVPPPP